MGGIYNALSAILEEYETAEIPDELNRMADFHKLGCVAEKALNWKPGSFTKAYNANIAIAQNEVLDDSLVAQAIIKMKEDDDRDFEGTYKDLLEELTRFRLPGNINPRKLSSEIDRVSDSLRTLHDIKIAKLRRTGGGSCLRLCFD